MSTIYTLDWEAIEAFVKARQPRVVEAGLLDDWGISFEVYRDGVWDDVARGKPFVGSYRSRSGIKAKMPNGDTVELVAMRPETAAEAEAYHRRMRDLLSSS